MDAACSRLRKGSPNRPAARRAASIQTALDNMPERWLLFSVDRDAVLFGTFMGLYSTDGAASFDVWLAAAEGDYSGMAVLSAAFVT